MAIAPIVAVDISPTDTAGLFSTFEWDQNIVTFGFAEQASDYPSNYSALNEPGMGFEALQDVTRDHVRTAFAHFADIIALEIEEAEQGVGDIAVAGSTRPFVALAYSPGGTVAAGDIWLNLQANFLDGIKTPGTNVLGAYEYVTLLHEIGHSFGLKHGHEGISQNSVRLPTDLDALEYSLLTYRSFIGDTNVSGYDVFVNEYPQTLMVLDIAALQQMYGANYDTQAGDTVYRFDPDTGGMRVNGVLQETPAANIVFRTLWDGGGTDTLDLSAYDTDLAIDLRPGQGSDLDVGGLAQRSQLDQGVFVDFHIYQSLMHEDDPASLIENATGGSGDDMLVGNAADNFLVGGAGTNTLFGGAGADVFAGLAADLSGDTIMDFGSDDRIEIITTETDVALGTSLGNQTLISLGAAPGIEVQGLAAFGPLVFEHDGPTLSVHAGSDTDIVLADGDDRYVVDGALALRVDAAAGDDVVRGGSLSDILLGGAGADVLIGNQGDDRLEGGAGVDALTGGAGADVFVIRAQDFANGDPADFITDFDTSEDVLELHGFGAPDGFTILDTASGAGLNLGQNRFVLFEGLSPSEVAAITPVEGQLSTQILSRDPARALSDLDERWLVPDTEAAQQVNGRGGDDVIFGGLGDDILDGGDGADLVSGNGGDDTLIGGNGSDELRGGLGSDTFVIRPDTSGSFAADIVADLDLVEDSLQLLGFGFTSVDQLNLMQAQTGLVLTLNPTHFVVLEGLFDGSTVTGSGVFDFG